MRNYVERIKKIIFTGLKEEKERVSRNRKRKIEGKCREEWRGGIPLKSGKPLVPPVYTSSRALIVN